VSENMNYEYDNKITLENTLLRQSATYGGWICPTCRNHKGNLKCSKNVFIGFVGANMTDCFGYEVERRNEP